MTAGPDLPTETRKGARAAAGVLAAVAVLSVVALALLWRLWAPNPADRLMIGTPDGDFARQFVAYRTFVARSWAELVPPLWNPHQYAGTPAWADPQMAVAYPFRAVQALAVALTGDLPMWAVELEMLAHLLLAGVFTFLLVARLTRPDESAILEGAASRAERMAAWAQRTSPALLSAIAFMAGGYLTGYPKEQLAVLDTAAWIPALMWTVLGTVDARARSERARWGLGVALATALIIAVGHPQTALYGLAWAGLWAVARGRHVRPVLAAWGGLGLGVAMAAVIWLPTWELLPYVARELTSADLLVGFSPRELAQVLLPHAGGQWWPLWLGAVTTGLALIGLTVRAAWFWLGSALVALLVGLGGRTPLLGALLDTVPGLDLFRHHERIAVVYSLGIAVAAGLALAKFAAEWPAGGGDAARPVGVDRGRSRRRRVGAAFLAAGFAALLVVVAGPGLASAAAAGPEGSVLRWPAEAWWAADWALVAMSLGAAGAALLLSARPAPWIVLIAALELITVNKMQGMSPRLEPFPRAAAIGELRDAMPGRVSSEANLPGGANAATVHRRFDVTGDSPFHLASIERLETDVPELVWWRLLNVATVLTGREFPEGAPVEAIAEEAPQGDAITEEAPQDDAIAEEAPQGDAEGQSALYRVLLDAPPVWLASVDPNTKIDALLDPAFDPRSAAPLSDADAALATGYLDAERAAWPVDEETLREHAARVRPGPELRGFGKFRVSAYVESPDWGLAVLSTAYAPGWRAKVSGVRPIDGSVTHSIPSPPVVAAYGALVASPLPPGYWYITWTYLPTSLILGAAISALAVALGVAIWLRTRASSP